MNKEKDTKLSFNNVMQSKRFIHICLVLLIVIALEVFVFNFRFFQGLGYEPVPLENEQISKSSVSNMGNSVFKFNENNVKLKFENINTEVKNIYIDMENTEKLPSNPGDSAIKKDKENKLIKVKITIDDKGNINGIEMPERSIVSNVERTKYIPLHLTGKSDTLTIQLNNVENKEIEIKSIVLNKGVPFSFNVVRVLLLIVVIGLIYVIRPKSEFYKYRLNIKSVKQRMVIGAVVIVEIVVMMAGCHINPVYVYNTFSHHFQYNELAEAIMDGHFYLNDEPDPKFEEMENPYDPQERSEKGVYTKFDHAYYNGKYYVYFGIVPALIFNIPALIFAGNTELKPISCILILIPLFVIMSYLLMYVIAKRFNDGDEEKVSLLHYIMLSTIFVSGTGLSFMLVCPDLYTLPIFTALIFAVSGLYFWLTADNGVRLSKGRLFAGSLCMALISGCRPQMLLAIFFAVPLFWKAVFKERRLFSKKGLGESLCFVLPVVLVAMFMFYYNYARFGSIFDFGANYNLTSNDMTARGFNIARIPQGLFYYLFQPMNVEGVFPYITITNFTTNYMGITIKEVTYGGILFLQPLLWMFLLIPKVKEELKKKGLYVIELLCIAFAVVIAAVDAVMAGILSRYFIDFGWLFVLAAIITVFAVYNKYNNSCYIKLINCYVPVCFVISLVISFLLVIGGKYYAPSETNPEIFWKIAYMIQFWM